MSRRGMFIALLAVAIAAGCSEVKKSDDNEAGSSAMASGSGGNNGGSGGDSAGDNGGGSGGNSAPDGGGGGGDSAGDGAGGDGSGGANATGSPDGGSADSGGGGTGGSADAGPINGIPCGRKTCTEEMCCADPFAGICGAPLNERACLPAPPPDATAIEGCPSINVMNIFQLPSCCVDGQCGITGTMFAGQSQGPDSCSELSLVATAIEAMGFVTITVPDPQPCP